MATNNPFSPTFGAPPPVVAGRDDILEAVEEALDTGPTHPDYTALLLGPRGAGKTVLLNAVEDLARARGWVVISDDGSPKGLLGRLARAANRLLEGRTPVPARRVSGVRAASFGLEFEESASVEGASEAAEELRRVLAGLGDSLATDDTGLLISLDELLSADLEEVRQFGAVMQHVSRREQRPIAFVGAALPQFEEQLESGDAATFLQRCARYDIGRLDEAATRLALAQPVEDRGASFDAAALEEAVAATSGYAFMVQLVGFHSWAAAPEPPRLIGTHEVFEGTVQAQRRIGRLVLSPMWKALSATDRRFLVAMAQDDGQSRLAEVAERLGVGVSYASVYRQRLLRAGMIISTGHGSVDLAHHAARDWIRAQPVPS